MTTNTASRPRPLLEVNGLTVAFSAKGRSLTAIDDLNFSVGAGETVALVGESGSGKTVTSLAIMGLLPARTARIAGGSVVLHERAGHVDITRLGARELSSIRGGKIAMIFQEPMTALNPVMTVGDQIAEAVMLHERIRRPAARERTLEALSLVGMPDIERQMKAYPHQLSGGMRQRVMIAMALCCSPSLLIADEPTTALDVTVQAQILDLIKSLQTRLGMGILFITHDLGVVAEVADRVCIMYAGEIVEHGPVGEVLERPRHPYTRALIRAIPDGPRKEQLFALSGRVPGLGERGASCLFASRCEYCLPDPCLAARPELGIDDSGHAVRCARQSQINATGFAGADYVTE